MKLVSWNLNGLEDENLDLRTEAAMFHILLGAPIEQLMQAGFTPDMPDIVMLQEVVPRTFHAHVAPHLKKAGFQLFPEQLSERSYFEVIATRQPIKQGRYIPFDWSDQGRGVCMIKTDGLTLMTAHMESGKSGASMRIDQAQQILDLMMNHKPCIFAGDANLRKTEWRRIKAKAPNDIQDAWEAVGAPGEYKTTWRNKSYNARYDRAWTCGLRVTSFKTFGAEKVRGAGQRASDHLGIHVSFE